MKLAYDQKTDSLYIHLSARPAATSEEISQGVVLDYDQNGVLVGIDVQRASIHADIKNLIVNNLPVSAIEAA